MNIQVTFVIDDSDVGAHAGKHQCVTALKQTDAGFPDRTKMTLIDNFATDVAGALDWCLTSGYDPEQFAEDGWSPMPAFAAASTNMLAEAISGLLTKVSHDPARTDTFVVAAREAADEVLAKGDPEALAVDYEGGILDGAVMAGYLTAIADLTTGAVDVPRELVARLRAAGTTVEDDLSAMQEARCDRASDNAAQAEATHPKLNTKERENNLMNIKVTVTVHDEDEGTIHASALAKYIVAGLPADEMVDQFAEEVLEGVVAHVMAPDYHHLAVRFAKADDGFDSAAEAAAAWLRGDDDAYGVRPEPEITHADYFDVGDSRTEAVVRANTPWSERGMKSSGGESPGFPPVPINKDYNDFVALAGGLRGHDFAQLVNYFRGGMEVVGQYEADALDAFVEASNYVGRNIEGDSDTFDYDEVDPDHALQATYVAGYLAATKKNYRSNR